MTCPEFIEGAKTIVAGRSRRVFLTIKQLLVKLIYDPQKRERGCVLFSTFNIPLSTSHLP